MAGLGAILVGAFPENSVKVMHFVGAALAIGVGDAAIFVLGCYLPLPRRWRDALRWYSALALLALALFGAHRDFGMGGGLMERFAQYPQTIWLILFGFYVSSDHYQRGQSDPPAPRNGESGTPANSTRP